MKNKPDAYRLEYAGKLNDVVKCDNCGFKCVLAQFLEGGECPSCKNQEIKKDLNGNRIGFGPKKEKKQKVVLGHIREEE